MSTLAIKAMLVFGLLFGSAGATAAMAANSLPDSPLYPVKLALEDARLAVTSGPDQQAQFHLAMAEERTEEMAQQALNGDVPGEATVSRLQLHLNEAFRLASQLSDEELAGVLTQARTQIRTQAEEMNQVQEQAGEPAQEPLRHAYQLLKQAEGEADVGLHNQQQFRFQFGPPQVEEPVPPEEPVPLEGAEPAPAQNPDAQPDCAPDCPGGEGAQHQYHGRESDTLPGNAYGEPQPCDPTQEECGDQNQHGQLEPEPGEHGHLYGQETNDNGPAGPPVDPGCGDDCVPAGNQNQEPNQEQKNQEQNQEQNQVQQPGPNGNDDNGQNGSLIGPGGSPAPGSGGSNDNGSGSDNGGSDSSGGNGAKNGGGNK